MGLVLIACLWLATRPYHGVIHDARLYTLQALYSDNFDSLKSDLYFSFGSQDNFTVFSLLYRPIVAALGVSAANIVTTVIGHLAWLATLSFMLTSLFGRTFVIPLLAGVIILPSAYGGLGIFHFGENFATPRLFAEALTFAGLAFAARRQNVVCGTVLLVAAAIHPLVTLPAIGILFFAAAERHRWLWAALAAAIMTCLVLAVAGVEPFVRIAHRFDGAWLDIIRERSPYAFVLHWESEDLFVTGAQFSLTFAGMICLTDVPHRWITKQVVQVAVFGLLASFLATDLTSNLLLTNLQLWRSSWILAVFANIWTAALIIHLPKASMARNLAIAGAALSAFAAVSSMSNLFGAPVLLAAGILAIFEHFHGTESLAPQRRWAAIILTTYVGLALAGNLLYVGITLTMPQKGPYALGLLTGLVALVLFLWTKSATRSWFRLACVAVLTCAIANSDRRVAWTRFIESGDISPELSQFAADSQPAYWERGVELNWLLLKQASYFSCLQGTGVMFYRGTALEYRRRQKGLAGLDSLDFAGSVGGLCGPIRDGFQPGPQSIEQIQSACRELPDLKTLFLNTRVAGTDPRTWRSPAKRLINVIAPVMFNDMYYRYDCADFT